MIWGLYGNVQRLKTQCAEECGIKTVQVFLIYLLLQHPDGLSATELAQRSRSTKGLVSRETTALLGQGIITADRISDRRRYGCKFLLTEHGRGIAERINAFAMRVQNAVSADIPVRELEIYYKTMGTLLKSFDGLTREGYPAQAKNYKHKGDR